MQHYLIVIKRAALYNIVTFLSLSRFILSFYYITPSLVTSTYLLLSVGIYGVRFRRSRKALVAKAIQKIRD